MTAIVGVIENSHVLIGSDSAAISGHSLSIRSDPKVFKIGEILIGYTSSFRMGQILEHHLTPPTAYEGEDEMCYMVRRFVPAVREILKHHGFAKTKDGEESAGTFLVGYRGGLYQIEDDYQVGRTAQGFQACGSGRDVALGSLYSTMGEPAHNRIQTALKAAEALCSGVRGPFHVVSSE